MAVARTCSQKLCCMVPCWLQPTQPGGDPLFPPKLSDLHFGGLGEKQGVYSRWIWGIARVYKKDMNFFVLCPCRWRCLGALDIIETYLNTHQQSLLHHFPYLFQCPVPGVITASLVKLQLFLISLCHGADGNNPGGEVQDVVQHRGGDGS